MKEFFQGALVALIFTRSSFWIWTTAALLLLAVGIYFQFLDPLTINVDGAFLLQCAQMLVLGKIPYVGVYDNNPPLAMYLHVIPVLVARLTPLHVVTVFICCVAALAFFSLGWCVLIFYRCGRAQQWAYLGPLLVGMTMITFTIGADYGQREHFFVLTCLPFLMLRLFRWQYSDESGFPQGKIESFLAGIFAGIGLCLKPYFLLPVIFSDLVCFWQQPKAKVLLAPENLGVIAAGLLYALHFAFCPKVMQHAFFGFIVPLVWNGYGAYDCDAGDLWQVALPDFYGGIFFGVPLFMPAFMAVVVSLAVCLRRRCAFLLPIAAWTIGGYSIFVLQHKGWSNHTIPMLSGIFFLVCLEYGVVYDFSRCNRRALLSAVAGFLIFVFLIAAGCRNSASLYENYYLVKDFDGQVEPGDRVLVLGCSLYPAYPLLTQLYLLPGSRYLHMFPIPMLEYWKKRSPDALQKLRLDQEVAQTLQNVADDISTNKPKMIVLENSLFERGDKDLVMSIYLARHGFIARHMQDYELVSTNTVYKFFRRKKT